VQLQVVENIQDNVFILISDWSPGATETSEDMAVRE
jgi:hypothetical protein